MGESIIVIIIIMIIIIFAIMFVAKGAKSKLEGKILENNEMDAVATAEIVTNLYELKCAKEGLKATCIDLHKAKALAKFIQGDAMQPKDDVMYLYYYNLFKDAKITITIIYPPIASPANEYVIYVSDASKNPKNQQTKPIIIPVSIHDAATDKVSFGVLTIARYSERIGT
jgi:hypothetical protein